MRHPRLALAFASLLLVGAALPVAAAGPSSTAKVAIIVGADTPQYLDDAEQLYAEAIKYSSNVVRVYSPNATWSAVKAATTNASVVIYLGHGNGWPSPYTFDPEYKTKDGFGLNATAAGTHANLKYYGEPSIRTLTLAPNAVVFLFHLCYASGNSEPTKAAPTLTVAKQRAANYASAFLAAGASAVIVDGHSHNPWYLRELFTTTETLSDLWHKAPNYHGHDIAYTAVHTATNSVLPGTAVLDPDNGGSAPSGFYRAITGHTERTTSSVLGRLPIGSVTLPGHDPVTATPIARNGLPTGRSASAWTSTRLARPTMASASPSRTATSLHGRALAP